MGKINLNKLAINITEIDVSLDKISIHDIPVYNNITLVEQNLRFLTAGDHDD